MSPWRLAAEDCMGNSIENLAKTVVQQGNHKEGLALVVMLK